MATKSEPGQIVSSAHLAAPHLYARHISAGAWKPYVWLKHVGWIVAQAVRDKNSRVILNTPPRHGKSELVSRYTPLWFLDRWPDLSVIGVAYGQSLATDEYGRWARDQARTNPRCGVVLQPDSDAANRWNTPQGGGMAVFGAEGPIIGRGMHLGIVDDPHKNWAESQSPIKRKRVLDWFTSTFMSRCEPGASVIVVMQRWHPDDLTGHLMKTQPGVWTQISLPAIAETDDHVGRRPGEALCPERFDRGALDARRLSTPRPQWDAMYQQNPKLRGSQMAYPHYSEGNIDHTRQRTTLRKELPLCVTFDFNINPGMHGLVGQYDEDRKEVYICHEIHAPDMPIVRPRGGQVESCMEVLRKIINRYGGWQWPDLLLFGDPSGRARTDTEGVSRFATIVQAIRKMGLPVEPKLRLFRQAPRVPDRLAAVNMTLAGIDGIVKTWISPRCGRLLYDLGNNRLDRDGYDLDKTDSERTHAGDALGYFVSRVFPVSFGTQTTVGAAVHY